MRETPQLGKNYSSNMNPLWFNIGLNNILLNNCLAVKMFLTRGQSAWGKLNYSTLPHQRLNVMQPKNEEFQQWLVGMTDGDGSFSVLRQNDKWTLTFKISQNTYNLRALYYIKQQLGVGKVSVESNRDMGSFRIRYSWGPEAPGDWRGGAPPGARKKIGKKILPIFFKNKLIKKKKLNY